jgi:hypothetical protein
MIVRMLVEGRSAELFNASGARDAAGGIISPSSSARFASARFSSMVFRLLPARLKARLPA